MYTIIPLLLAQIQVLNNQIKFLLLFIAKNIPLRTKPSDWNSPKYNKLKIDKLPIIKTTEKKNYKSLLMQYLKNSGKPLKPVQARGKYPVPNDIHCPCCNAPHEFIYDNNGGRGQFLCKVCGFHFNIQNFIFKPIHLCCPYCNHSLNQVPKIEKTHFKKYKIEDKENISENLINNIKYKTEKKSGIKSRINKDKSEFKNFYINEKGVIVFKPNDKPTTHIKIVNSKPDLSKYINELKIYGKKRNISIYEAPPPTKKIFVRPIKI